MNEINKIGRRKVIGGLGAGLATLAISPVFGATKKGYPESSALPALEDPTTKYPNCRLKASHNHGRVWLVKWIPVRIMVKKAIKGPGV